MYYIVWNVGGREYKLRLTTMSAIQVEKQLGMGMTDIVSHLMDSTVIVTLLWGAMQQFNHGTSFKDVCAIYDQYLEAGGDVEQMTDVLLELFAQVGIGGKSKNAKGQNAASLTEL